MGFIKKIKKAIQCPELIPYRLLPKRYISDSICIKAQFYLKMGKTLDLKNPVTFNEKIQWLKLHCRCPEYTQMVDKYEVRKYVTKIAGDEYLIPLLGIWNKFDDIDFNALPNQFVLKCTHSSGGIVICRNKYSLDIEKVRAEIQEYLKINYFFYNREWVYKNVKPKIIAEKYMSDNSSVSLNDYKFFCFNGIPKCLYANTDRYGGTMQKNNSIGHGINSKEVYFDLNWHALPFTRTDPRGDENIKKPYNFNLMLELCKKLSQNTKFLRVDLYEINQKVYFGELTFYPENGLSKFNPPEWDKIFGDWLVLPSTKVVKKSSKYSSKRLHDK
jgi:hypothetical protein